MWPPAEVVKSEERAETEAVLMEAETVAALKEVVRVAALKEETEALLLLEDSETIGLFVSHSLTLMALPLLLPSPNTPPFPSICKLPIAQGTSSQTPVC
jgi:hypothetical protein